MRRALALGLILAGGVVVTASTGRAQEQREAIEDAAGDEELIARGVELRKQGRDAEALALFERAYARAPSARALAQIALANQALGRWLEAEQGLVDALRDTADPWIARQRVYLEQSLSAVREHLGVPLAPSSGLPPGPHEDAQGASRTPRVVPIRAADLTPPERAAGKVVLLGTGALVLVGAAALAMRELEAQRYDAAGCAPTLTESRYARCPSYRDLGYAAQTVAVAAFAPAAVGAAAAGVLLLGDWRRPPAVPTDHVACRWTGTAIDCGIAF